MSSISVWIFAYASTMLILFHNSRAMAHCLGTNEKHNEAGSCTFENGVCGWSTGYGCSLNWTRQHFFQSFMYVNMSEQTANSSAILQSPWICFTEGSNISLRFRFSLGPCNMYGLTVYLQANNSETRLLWLGRNISGEITPPIVINSSVWNYNEFQIIIQGIKLDDRLCEQDGIYIDDIQLISPATDKFFEPPKTRNDVPVTSSDPYKNDTTCLNSSMCTFEQSSCGWHTASGTEWYLRSNLNTYVTVAMSEESSSRLQSPWICPTKGHHYTLNFRFFYGSKDRYQLSVFLETELNTSQMIWRGMHDASWTFHNLEFPIKINCTECIANKFKIVFEGKKLKSGFCFCYDEIEIDDIEYKVEPLSLTTASLSNTARKSNPTATSDKANPTLREDYSTTRESVTTTENFNITNESIIILSYFVSGNVTTNFICDTRAFARSSTKIEMINSSNNKSERIGQSLSTGSIAAVVVTIAVPVIISIVVVTVLCRKKCRREAPLLRNVNHTTAAKTPGLLPADQSDAVIVNAIYTSNELEFTGSTSHSQHDNCMNPKENLTSHHVPSGYDSSGNCTLLQTSSNDAREQTLYEETQENYDKISSDTSFASQPPQSGSNVYDHICN